MNHLEPSRPSPEYVQRIERLSHHSPLVSCIYHEHQQGHASWDNALVSMVEVLYRQMKTMEDIAMRRVMLDPPPPIRVENCPRCGFNPFSGCLAELKEKTTHARTDQSQGLPSERGIENPGPG